MNPELYVDQDRVVNPSQQQAGSLNKPALKFLILIMLTVLLPFLLFAGPHPVLRLPPVRHRLVISVYPTDAQITVKNIDVPYKPGIQLDDGRYHVEISRPGYQTTTGYVDINQADWVNLVVLTPLAPTPPPQDTQWLAEKQKLEQENHQLREEKQAELLLRDSTCRASQENVATTQQPSPKWQTAAVETTTTTGTKFSLENVQGHLLFSRQDG